jgi:predicted Zn-dependent protease
MNRRRFLAAGCAACASLAHAQTASWQAPSRFTRPDLASEEGGLWAMMDREEQRARRSPFALRDRELQEYVRGIACKLGGEHCVDVRVHLMRTPLFNATMAPNGMMTVWTGLMLRVDNEAQLAAVLGHEMGHYMERHSLERLRAAKEGAALGTLLGLFGAVGALGQLGLAAGMSAYSRDHERAADRIGVILMRNAGYDPAEAAKVWRNLKLEIDAKPDGGARNPLFASHPAPEERQEELAKLAATSPGGVTNEDEWQRRTAPFQREWLVEEVKRGQHEETLALFARLIARSPQRADYRVARGETYRLRANDGADLDLAIAEFKAAASVGGEPPEAHRGLGMIYRQRNQPAEAKASLQRYLEMAPEAPDAAMVKSYLEELKT